MCSSDLATLDPAKAFGSSAFGPLKFRVVENGAEGDWQPLATLVRLPELHDLKCPADDAEQCRLSGANLFLVDSVASDPEFAHPVQVPDGFPGYVLPVPRPEGGQLYLKLRDDPSVVNQVMLAAEKLPPPPGEAERHAARAAYRPGEVPPAPGAAGQAGSPTQGSEPQTTAPPEKSSQPPANPAQPPAAQPQTQPQNESKPQDNSLPHASAGTGGAAPSSQAAKPATNDKPSESAPKASSSGTQSNGPSAGSTGQGQPQR